MSLLPPFTPPWWARGPHAQTILAHLWPGKAPELPATVERLDLADGDALALRVSQGSTPVVLHLFHGLGGHARSSYMRAAAALGAARGWTVVAANHRGSGEGRGWARRPYHSGATADLAAVLAWGRARWPEHRHLAVGFSISANILLLLLGRDAQLPGPDAALAVNPPGDLTAASFRLQRGLNRLYDRRFVRLLRAEVEARGLELPPTPSLRDFDAAYTAAQAGFPSREAYYEACGCGPHLAKIRVPTLLISAADDPFAPASDLGPVSPTVRLEVQRHGGHMGYLSANPRRRRWLDEALEAGFDALSAP